MFEKIIKIKGKNSFDQLSLSEVADMIDSFLLDGSSSFDKSALSEFLIADISDPELIRIREKIQSHGFASAKKDYEWPSVDREYLFSLSEKLRH